jgi:hypothetical protein
VIPTPERSKLAEKSIKISIKKKIKLLGGYWGKILPRMILDKTI